MDSFLTYIPLISVAIVAGLFTMALVNFSTVRKNMQVQSERQMRNLKIQSEQQIYSRITLPIWQKKVRFLQSDLL
jgi:type II secretory pathway pseudopilin PulG